MATLTVSGQVLLHAHPINMHNFLLSRVFQSDRFKAKFSDFFGDQIAFQAGYFETDHDGYGIYVLPLIICFCQKQSWAPNMEGDLRLCRALLSRSIARFERFLTPREVSLRLKYSRSNGLKCMKIAAI